MGPADLAHQAFQGGLASHRILGRVIRGQFDHGQTERQVVLHDVRRGPERGQPRAASGKRMIEVDQTHLRGHLPDRSGRQRPVAEGVAAGALASGERSPQVNDPSRQTRRGRLGLGEDAETIAQPTANLHIIAGTGRQRQRKANRPCANDPCECTFHDIGPFLVNMTDDGSGWANGKDARPTLSAV
jgi:hypothetical protein